MYRIIDEQTGVIHIVATIGDAVALMTELEHCSMEQVHPECEEPTRKIRIFPGFGPDLRVVNPPDDE